MAELTRREFCAEITALGVATTACAAVDGDGRMVLEGSARKKRSLGQYFTEGACWLQPQVIDFIRNSKCSVAYDPFAGSGCLFVPVTNAIDSISKTVGLDIDPAQGWKVNDSLIKIPSETDAIIVTNPPYLSNYSASRKRLGDGLKKYFSLTQYDDVYLLALDRMLEAQKNVVAIIPETFINSPYRQKELLSSITILEENPFMLRFDFKENIDYDWENGIKVSSRLLTLVSIDVTLSRRQSFVDECNRVLAAVREKSHDIMLSPFKGNMKNGVRRRRLDFQTCRAIIERAYHATVAEKPVARMSQGCLYRKAI